MNKEINPKEQAKAELTGTMSEIFPPKKDPYEVEAEIEAGKLKT